MSAPAARQSIDVCDGGCISNPSVAGTGSPNVYVNGMNVMRLGDPFTPHTRLIEPFDTHGRSIVSASTTVNANGQGVARQGDGLSCGANNATGSPNVFVGG